MLSSLKSTKNSINLSKQSLDSLPSFNEANKLNQPFPELFMSLITQLKTFYCHRFRNLNKFT